MSEQLEVSDDLYERLRLFKQEVVDQLLGEESPSFEVYVEGIIDEGLNEMLRRVLGSDPGTLSKSLVQLARRHPPQFFDYMREILDLGEEAEKERVKSQIGFLASAGRE